MSSTYVYTFKEKQLNYESREYLNNSLVTKQLQITPQWGANFHHLLFALSAYLYNF